MKLVKFSTSLTLLGSIFLVGLTFCASAGSRGAVAGLSYSPGGNGYGYKGTGFSRADFAKWEANNRSKIRASIDSLEEGYIFEAIGHTDSSGPRTATSDGRKGNVWYAEQRASKVYEALIKLGYPRSKLGYRGVADDELLDSSDPQGAINRRVTFAIGKK